MVDILFGIAIGVMAVNFVNLFGSKANLFRPSAEWQPEANCDDDYKRAAYKAAGKKLGVRVKFGQPVPCSAGTDACRGMIGIWIHREDAKKLKYHEFTDAMWKEYSRITS